MLLGYYFVKLAYTSNLKNVISSKTSIVNVRFLSNNKATYVYLTISLIVLLFGRYKSEAFSLGFTDYFLKMRGSGASGDVTGISVLDNIIKIVIAPMIIASSIYELNSIKNTNEINRVPFVFLFLA